ncbi:50S ribosomal protein L6 [Paenibacillus sp. MAHUQ-46]|uniref:50S ribosomal protein L6 n=1 Tax=Paenibacillus roseus TaxID=2798579 RepID=A0A934J6R6_9BACL|nr:50S ribosomal protein L6 [Paenibacillus roseus]MBJ6361776.1 50S ribosomal protein L6 [Paenibacillus roseus]
MSIKEDKLIINYNYNSIVKVPESVKIISAGGSLHFIGPLGYSRFNLYKLNLLGIDRVGLFLERNQNRRVIVIKVMSTRKSYLHLYRSILESKCFGVSRGFLVYLDIFGIGYRVAITGFENIMTTGRKYLNELLTFKLGYSHDIGVTLPEGARAYVQSATSICLFGIEKNQLTQLAHSIRALRKPGAYKQKGIQLSTEKLKFKTGKKK